MLDNTNYQNTLPESWCQVKHEEIATINPKLNSEEISDELQVSFLPMAAVEEKTGRFDLSDIRQYGKVKKGYTQFTNGDLLFAKITPCMENGKVVVVGNLVNGIGCGSTEFHVSRPIDLVNRKYLFFYFVQESFRRDAKRNMTGSAGQLRVPRSFFAEAQIPFPPLTEQQRIVDRIEEIFSDLDNGIDSFKKAKQQLKIYRQAVLKWAFEGKLTAQWREEQQWQGKLESADTLLAKIKAERDQRYQKELEVWQAEVEAWDAISKEGKKPRKPKKAETLSPLNQDELNQLSKLPQGWKWIRYGLLCSEVRNGISSKPDSDNAERILRISAVRPFYLDVSDFRHITNNDGTFDNYLLRMGDILFTRYNGSRHYVGICAKFNSLKRYLYPDKLIRTRLISEYILAG